VTSVKTADLVKLTRARQLAESGEGQRIRLAAGLSYAQFGAACGVSDVTVLRWESRQRRPSGTPALKYCDLLDSLAAVTTP
jgi:DNA-binding transcriptional regulator YiaG